MKVAVIGHVEADSTPIRLPAREEAARRVVASRALTHLVDGDGFLRDHLSWRSAASEGERLSIWDMSLCSGLLLDAKLRELGHASRLFNALDADDVDGWGALRDYAPRVAALSTTFVLSPQQFRLAAKLLRQALPDAFIVAGGHHVSTTLMRMNADERRDYLFDSGLDALVNDMQGEAALAALCAALRDGRPLDGVANLLWRGADGAVRENARAPEDNAVADLRPDFAGVAPGGVVHVRTARSCSFKCAFCTYPAVAGELALCDVPDAMSWLRRARERGVSTVVFTDDTFNVPAERFEALLDAMIAEGPGFRWFSFLRCQYLEERTVEKMRRAGCAGVFLGIESGSDRILKNMKKGAVARFYRDGVRWLKNNGVPTFGAFIVGFPGETEDTVRETRRFVEDSGLDYYFLQTFYYLHNAPIFRNAERYGLTGEGAIWFHRTMDWKQASAHVARCFDEIEGPVHVHPDFNMWEYVYLTSRGVSDEGFRRHREEINRLTRAQLRTFGLIDDD